MGHNCTTVSRILDLNKIKKLLQSFVNQVCIFACKTNCALYGEQLWELSNPNTYVTYFGWAMKYSILADIELI